MIKNLRVPVEIICKKMGNCNEFREFDDKTINVNSNNENKIKDSLEQY